MAVSLPECRNGFKHGQAITIRADGSARPQRHPARSVQHRFRHELLRSASAYPLRGAGSTRRDAEFQLTPEGCSGIM